MTLINNVVCQSCGRLPSAQDSSVGRYAVQLTAAGERSMVWRCPDCDFARSTNLSTAKAIDNSRTTAAQRKHARSSARGGEAAKQNKSIDAAVKRGDL